MHDVSSTTISRCFGQKGLKWQKWRLWCNWRQQDWWSSKTLLPTLCGHDYTNIAALGHCLQPSRGCRWLCPKIKMCLFSKSVLHAFGWIQLHNRKSDSFQTLHSSSQGSYLQQCTRDLLNFATILCFLNTSGQVRKRAQPPLNAISSLFEQISNICSAHL